MARIKYYNPETGKWEYADSSFTTSNESGGKVAYDEAQELTDEQKAQARENIGAADIADIPSDEYINDLINTALGVIENGTY